MRLSSVIAGTGASLGQALDGEVSLVTSDSRQVKHGALFVAIAGGRADGHDFAAAAVRAGAVAVLAERPVDCAPAALLLVPSARRALALAAANLHGRPAERLALLRRDRHQRQDHRHLPGRGLRRAAGVPSGVIGTVSWRVPGANAPRLPHHARRRRAAGAARRDGRRRRPRRHPGGLLPRPRPGAGGRALLPRRRLHQPHPRPPRLPPGPWRPTSGQAAPLRRAARPGRRGGGERRRRPRGPHRGRALRSRADGVALRRCRAPRSRPATSASAMDGIQAVLCHARAARCRCAPRSSARTTSRT